MDRSEYDCKKNRMCMTLSREGEACSGCPLYGQGSDVCIPQSETTEKLVEGWHHKNPPKTNGDKVLAMLAELRADLKCYAVVCEGYGWPGLKFNPEWWFSDYKEDK